jgi:hypothetical protein
MPLLNFPELTQGYAKAVLMALYLSHPPFVKELDSVRKPYIEVNSKYAKNTLESFQEKPQSNTEYYQTMIKYLSGEGGESPFNIEQRKDIKELEPYFDALIKLVEKWIFKAPWAVVALFIFDMTQFVAMVPFEEQRIPLEIFERMVPWSPPLPPLKIEVSAWTFFEYLRDEIMNEISDRLFEYEEELKKIGIKEFPSSLSRHAKWWFDHYVNHKKYDEIAQQETYTLGGSLISYAKNVGRAVQEFGKLVDINPRLK